MLNGKLLRISFRKCSKSADLISILLLTFIVLTSLNFDLTIATSETVDGSWTAKMNGTSIIEGIYTFDINSTMNGIFSGNASNGEWTGTYNASYQISPLDINEQDSGEISGTYMMTVDESGLISGDAAAQVSGFLTGELQLTINGTESESGKLNGTLIGSLNVSTISYGGTPIPLNGMVLNISGDFGGVAQKEGPESSSGTNIINFETIPSTNGKIIFDGIEYQNGDNVSKEEGNYTATAEFESFMFSGWETIGNISLTEYNMVSTICIVSGNGTLRLVLASSSNTTSPSPTTIPPPQSGCLIVTATLGTEMAPEIIFMRHVRDDLIGSNEVGRILVVNWNNFYYSWSPPVAQLISNSQPLQYSFQILLIPLIIIIHSTAYIYSIIAPLSPTASSILAFTFAAIASILVYIITPSLLLLTITKRFRY